MKKIFLSIAVVIVCAFAFWFAHSDFGFNPNYSVAIVNTKSGVFDTKVECYDNDLNLVQRKKIYMSMVGKCLTSVNEKKYMLSSGTDLLPCKKVLELNSETGKATKYDVGQSFNLAMTANDKYVFTSNAVPGAATIIRCDKSSGEIIKLELPKVIGAGLFIFDDNILYAFADDSDTHVSNLYIIDPDQMKILKTIDIKDKGYHHDQCVKVEDDLYFLDGFTYNGVTDGQPISENRLVKFNTKTYQFETIEIGLAPEKLVHSGDYLYITYDGYSTNPKMITLYNLKTGEQTQKELQNYIDYIAVDAKNQKLYSTDRHKLYQYDLKTFELLKSVEPDSSAKGFFIKSMFVK